MGHDHAILEASAVPSSYTLSDMAWQKVPPQHIESFQAALPMAPGVELRKMFGCPAGFVSGNMFCGAHEENIVVRLGEKACESALQQPGFRPFEPLPGRVMKEYVCLPHDRLTDLEYLEPWFRKALDYAETLPREKAKKRASKKVIR